MAVQILCLLSQNHLRHHNKSSVPGVDATADAFLTFAVYSPQEQEADYGVEQAMMEGKYEDEDVDDE